jgi:hypothetical protein
MKYNIRTFSIQKMTQLTQFQDYVFKRTMHTSHGLTVEFGIFRKNAETKFHENEKCWKY